MQTWALTCGPQLARLEHVLRLVHTNANTVTGREAAVVPHGIRPLGDSLLFSNSLFGFFPSR
jgi:hypothetical protein